MSYYCPVITSNPSCCINMYCSLTQSFIKGLNWLVIDWKVVYSVDFIVSIFKIFKTIKKKISKIWLKFNDVYVHNTHICTCTIKYKTKLILKSVCCSSNLISNLIRICKSIWLVTMSYKAVLRVVINLNKNSTLGGDKFEPFTLLVYLFVTINKTDARLGLSYALAVYSVLHTKWCKSQPCGLSFRPNQCIIQKHEHPELGPALLGSLNRRIWLFQIVGDKQKHGLRLTYVELVGFVYVSNVGK